MLRLTLRSGKDGRFLARIIDPGGYPFVLDFGDKRIIDDAQQRLQHGFTMWRFGQLINAQPKDPDMVMNLAEFYCGEGLLVALEEPTWSGRDHTLDERIPVPAADLELFAGVSDVPDRDDSTELADDLTDLGEFLQPGTEEVDLEDQATEIVDLPRKPPS